MPDPIDILYVAYNRLAFTEKTFETLLTNTNWEHVRKLVIHDDGSEDGTSEYLHEAHTRAPVPCAYTINPLRSPPAVMNRYVARDDTAERFCKIDNDIMVPEGWLDALLQVVDDDPTIDLLGMEAARMGVPGHLADWDGRYRFEPATHIGGVGLMKTEAFLRHRQLREDDGRFGFDAWQQEFKPRRGWITPDLMVCSLDQVPLEPWQSLAAEYVEHGWSRPWPPYHARWTYYHAWWSGAPLP